MSKQGTSGTRKTGDARRKGRSAPAKQLPDPKRDSEDVERAVYDGMQDLRAAKRGAPR